MYNGVDKDGNLYLTYSVDVSHRGKRVLILGTGLDAVCKFYNIAKAGIHGAVETKFMFSYNVIVTLKGRDFIKLIEEHYPEITIEERGVINPDKEYVIDCYDMS